MHGAGIHYEDSAFLLDNPLQRLDMAIQRLLSLSLLVITSVNAAETLLGAYMFHRHGDRTAKSTPPTNLTDLGYTEVYRSGQYYRSRYVASDASLKISRLNSDVVMQSQISVSAPADTVLQNSAQGFLQGLYPPVGTSLGTQHLANGSNITTPLNGYQLIPISLAANGAGSENNAWLQSATGCSNAIISSNNYYSSPEYEDLFKSTVDFYKNLAPAINNTFNSSQINFKNAYSIFDLINVAEINNASIHDFDDILTDDVLLQTRTLADTHEFNLAYNSSDNARAISGATLAAQAVQYLNNTITAKNNLTGPRLGIQFGAYASFQSFFGLANLTAANADFFGIPDYASVMIFELFTNTTMPSTGLPSANDLYVRFLFNNGSSATSIVPNIYPLFGGSAPDLAWNDFVNGMNKFAVGSTEQWCHACGNTTGTCAQFSSSPSSSGTGSNSSGNSNGISTAVGGVIGAMVTLGVILGVEALIMLIFGLRLVSKKRTILRGPANGDSEMVPKA
ncbi:MAG: hypothetical protein M1820_000009 [Bogoriella megaspora]|nr:MAG: hypothetical protein M1820_000009 [Bogoriella megaspora]